MAVPELRTGRLLLRPWTGSDDDAAALYAVLSHDEVWPWLGADPRPCPDVEAARRTCLRWAEVEAPGQGLWAVEAPGTSVVRPVSTPCDTLSLLTTPA